MLDKVKDEIFQNLQMLFAEAAVDEIAGDMVGFMEKLKKITAVADALGIETKITQVTIDLKETK